jgi:hypothetical protein
MEIPQNKEEDPVDTVLFLALALALSFVMYRRSHLNFINVINVRNKIMIG